MWTKVYKAVRELPDGTLAGAYPIMPNPVLYTPGVPTKPGIPGSFLYAFDSLDNAKAFFKEHNKPFGQFGPLQAWLANAEVVGVEKVTCSYSHFTAQFWQDQWYAMDAADCLVFPTHPGTLWCTSITLEERLV